MSCHITRVLISSCVLKTGCYVVMSGIRPDRSKGGRYKIARSAINGDFSDHAVVTSSLMNHNSSGKCLHSLHFCSCANQL